MDYRKEIDGLRALAVCSVMLNHISENILPSGYLGVDIFFVISGYVITASLYNRNNDNLSDLILGFYARRIKRLFPALVIFVVLSSIFISLFNESPQTQLKTGLTSLFGLSNLYLIRQATDYFGDSAKLNIFTHTWSLGVEEQFYVIFPMIVWFTSFRINSERGHKFFLLTIGALALLSLSAFVYLNLTNPSFSYFSMPTRFWELAAGSFAYWLTYLCKYIKISNKYSVLSLVLTIALLGILVLPEKYHTSTTIAITLITVLLICFIQPRTIAYTIFSARVFVYIGLISYSLYLWHWGILILSKWTIGIHWWSL
ncbi:MAG: acyltransferase, partial [Chromatiaceae bacterium]